MLHFSSTFFEHVLEKNKAKIRLYKSNPIPVEGTALCYVAFGDRSEAEEWNIIEEPILSGVIALKLAIIKLHKHA